MMQLAQKILQKPQDSTIRIIRVIFAILIILIVALGWDTFTLNFSLPDVLKFGLFIFAFIGLVRGLFDPGVFRKKIWKWTIVGLGASMVLLALVVIDEKESSQIISQIPVASGSGGISLSEIEKNAQTQVATAPNYTTILDTDTWFQFLGWILLFIGLIFNSKNITTKNERYGEVIKKIRV